MPFDPTRLKSLMAARGLSQAELARRTGISHPRVNAICHGVRVGQITMPVAERLARALEVPVDDLLTHETRK